MKVYVITMGEYSDYHICGVALNKEDAEILKRRYSSKWDTARIEEYDTENSRPILDGKTAYEVRFLENGNVSNVRSDVGLEYFEPSIELLNPINWSGVSVRVYLFADSTESAIKIASEKRAKFLAKKIGL